MKSRRRRWAKACREMGALLVRSETHRDQNAEARLTDLAVHFRMDEGALFPVVRPKFRYVDPLHRRQSQTPGDGGAITLEILEQAAKKFTGYQEGRR